jgi:hypothetical protein
MGLLQNYNPTSQYASPGAQYLTTQWVSEWSGQPYVKAAENVFDKYTLPVSNSKLLNLTAIPFHNPRAGAWTGQFKFDRNTGLFLQARRALWWIGTSANLIEMSVLDITSFSKSPQSVAITAGNIAPLTQVAMVNGCFTGIPVDESGNTIENSDHIVMTDQVYGGSIAVLPQLSLPAWSSNGGSGTVYAAGQKVTANGNIYICIVAGTGATSGSGPTGTGLSITDGSVTWRYLFAATMQATKLVNPTLPGFMPQQAWTTAQENYAITPQNVIAAIVSLQQQRADNGIQLGLATRGKVNVGVPYGSYEQMREIVEVFRQIPGTGVPGTPVQQVPITGGGGASQVVYSVMDNPAFGRADLVAVPGMQASRWFVGAAPPPDMPPARSALFVHTMGGSMGEWEPNETFVAMNGDKVPHIQVIQFPAGPQSPMFTGSMPGSVAGDIGVGMWVAEGFAFGSSPLFRWFDTGYFGAELI